MPILPAIVPHTVMVCVDKRERGVALQAMLQQRGYTVVVCQSLYDALRTVPQELPHLIISESNLSDGNAGNLYDKLQASETLKDIPIIAWAMRKHRDELAPLMNRQFAGLIIGRPHMESLLSKVAETLAVQKHSSPYFLSAEKCGVGSMVITRDATAIAKSDGFLIVSSGNRVDFRSPFHAMPQWEGRAAASLTHGVNLRQGKHCLNLFPMDRIIGSGREWIHSLREIPARQSQKRVALSMTKRPQTEKHPEQWGELLSGHGFQVFYKENLESSLSDVSQGKDLYECVFHIGEITEKQREALDLLSNLATPLVLATNEPELTIPHAIILGFPCGLGEILHALTAACRRFQMYRAYLNANAHGAMPLTFRSRVNFLGMDETGGYLQMKFPLETGTVIKAEHPFFDEFFPGQSLTITRCAPVPGPTPLWQARFDVPLGGQSKAKRWEKLLEQLAS